MPRLKQLDKEIHKLKKTIRKDIAKGKDNIIVGLNEDLLKKRELERLALQEDEY